MSATPITTTHTIDLPYEIDMLRASYQLLPRFGAADPWLKNLIIEGFWLHARNLIELFLAKRNAANLWSMADAGYTPVDRQKLELLYGDICKQISHLQDGRPVVPSAKLNLSDPQVIALLEAEISHFLTNLIPAVASSVVLHVSAMVPPQTVVVTASGPSSTNHTTSVTSASTLLSTASGSPPGQTGTVNPQTSS